MEEKSPEKKSKQVDAFLRFSGLAIQMGVTIYLGSLLGEYLDKTYHNTQALYTQICTLSAVFLATFSVIRQVIKIQD